MQPGGASGAPQQCSLVVPEVHLSNAAWWCQRCTAAMQPGRARGALQQCSLVVPEVQGQCLSCSCGSTTSGGHLPEMAAFTGQAASDQGFSRASAAMSLGLGC